MKRLLSLFLAAIMIIICLPTAAEAATAPAEEDFSDMLKLLELTGIYNTDFSEKDVTRGEFAAYLVRLKGIGGHFGEYGKAPFYDVNSGTEYASEIAAAKDMGLINGYSDGNFRPENTISVIEAAICMIRLLGYDVKAKGMGGYPGGYYSVLRELKLLEGIPSAYTDALNSYNAVRLIYNTLHTKIMTGKEYGDKVTYEVSDGMTLLYSSFDIAYVEGIINGIDITNLFGENDLPYYSVYVGNNILYSGSYNINYLLGYNVRAYYKYENGKDRIKLAVALKNKNNERIVNIKDITSISDGYINYETANGEIKKYSYDKNAPVIYNGTNTKETFNTEIYNDENGNKLHGEVKLLDNNGDGKADVLFVEAYRDFVAGHINYEKNTIYDYFDVTKKYELDVTKDEPYVEIYDTDEDKTDAGVIKEGVSIMIYESKNDAYQKYIRAYISEKKVTGKIISVNEENGRTVINTEEEKYILSEYAKENALNIIPGRTAVMLLNRLGEIAKFDYSEDPGDYRTVMLCSAKKGAGFEADLNMKFMDENADFISLKSAEKIKMDGIYFNIRIADEYNNMISRLKEASKCISSDGAEPSGNYCFQIVKYGTNSDGEVNYIDTVLNKNGTPMTADEFEEGNELYFGINQNKYLQYSSSQKTLGLSVIVDDNAKIFMYPPKGNESDDDFYAVRENFFQSSTSYPGVTYYFDTPDGFKSSVFMRQYSANVADGDLSAMNSQIVTKVTDVVNRNGEKAKKWYLFDQGVKNEIIVKEDMNSANSKEDERIPASEVKPGDIIYYTVNEVTGEADMFLMMYSYKEDKAYTTSSVNNQMIRAEVLRSTPNGIKLLFKLVNSDGSPNEFETIFNSDAGKALITVFNTSENKAKVSDYVELIGSEQNSSEYDSRVVVRRYSSYVIREIYVFK